MLPNLLSSRRFQSRIRTPGALSPATRHTLAPRDRIRDHAQDHAHLHTLALGDVEPGHVRIRDPVIAVGEVIVDK